MNASQMWFPCLMAASGGAIGALSRFVICGWVHRAVPQFLPLATLTVNVVGCLVIGFVLTWDTRDDVLSEASRIFLVTGILGGLTTFSTFGYETHGLLQLGNSPLAFGNIAANVLLGLAAVRLGAYAAQWIA